jgi:hypothetical protein
MWSNKRLTLFSNASVITNLLYFSIWVIINNFYYPGHTKNIFMYGTFIPFTISLIIIIFLVTASLLSLVVFYKRNSYSIKILIPFQLFFILGYFYHYSHLVK